MVDSAEAPLHAVPVAETKPAFTHRVFLPHALGADEFLRVTFHAADGVVVFSHWDGPRCIAATPVSVTDTPELATLLVQALGHAVSHLQPQPGDERELLAPEPATAAEADGDGPDAQVIPLRWHDS